MRSETLLTSVFAFALFCVTPGVVFADDTTATPAPSTGLTMTTLEGRVVGNESGKLVIDLGSRAGVKTGNVAELWRPLKLKNPATGRVIEDRYRIGSVRIAEVLEVVSFADAEGELRRPVTPGDIVIARVERTETAPTTTKTAPADRPPPAPVVVEDPDSRSVTTLFESLKGQVPEARVQAIRVWLKANPKNRFAQAVADEGRALLRLAAERDERRAVAALPEDQLESPTAARFDPPKQGLSGQPLEFGIETRGDVQGVVIHARHSREVAYVTTAFHRVGENFWTATIPANRVLAPELEYFIEGVRRDGTAVPIVGTVLVPLHVNTPDTPTPAPALKHRSIASAYADYADYNRFLNNDRLWQVEGYFGMRFADEGVRAVRTGFGVYRGVGGSIEELDVLHLPGRPVGLTYGYLEGEFGFSHTVSFLGRAAVGLGEDGVTGGAQAHIRIGNDMETNLLIGGEVLGGIGLRGMAQLELLPAGRFPFMVRTEVTNQPAGIRPSTAPTLAPGAQPTANEVSDVGGRVILQGGYRVATPLVIFLRGSAQGRTINHAGVGFGGGMTYEW